MQCSNFYDRALIFWISTNKLATMEFFLQSTIIVILFTIFHSLADLSCKLETNQLLCSNLTFSKSDKLNINNNVHNLIQSIKFLNCNLSTIPSGMFRDYKNTTTIYLNNSQINNIEGRAFEELINLKQLYIYTNKIEEIKPATFTTLINLKILNLGDNKIRKLQPGMFEPLLNLDELILYHNKISFIEPGTFNSLTNLKLLNLQHNNLNAINRDIFANLSNLETLYLGYNNLGSILEGTFDDLINLEQLFIGVNRIKTLEQTKFNNNKLLKLHLDNNLLTTIDCDAFSNLSNLAYLHLEYNKLRAIPEDCFQASKYLNGLFISDNQLSLFDGETFLSSHLDLSFISLNNNKWKCHVLNRFLFAFLNRDVLVTDRDTTNSRNVEGIACSVPDEDYYSEEPNIEMVIYYDYNPRETTKIMSNSPTTEKYENVINNTQDSNVTQNINQILNDFKRHYINFSNNTSIFMLVIVLLLLIIVVILTSILCRSMCCKKASKIEKNTEMSTCRYSNLSFM